MEWEWRRVKRGFGKKERQNLIDELQYWNNALKNCFERQEIPSDEGGRSVQELKAQFDQTQCDAIRENARAVHKALQSGWGCVCPKPHGGNLHLEWHNGNMAAPAVFKMALSYRKAQNGQPCTSDEFWKNILVQIEDAATQLPPPVPDSPTSPAVNAPAVCSSSPSRRTKFVQSLGLDHASTSSKSKSVKSNRHFGKYRSVSFTAEIQNI